MTHADRRAKANEHEICNEKRGHRANQCRVVGELEHEPLSGIEMVVPCTERRQQKQAGGSQIQADGCQGGCF